MSWQLIFTSAPRSLKAGQSGFGTVAQSADLREALVPRLEQLSGYHRPSAAAGADAFQPVICSYRVLDLRGTKYHVLSRLQDAGLDFTNRTNHLAHHIVFAPEELDSLPSPAVIFQKWDGWREKWQGEPRLLTEADWGNLARLPRVTPLDIRAWRQWTGDAGCAALLLEKPFAQGCHLLLRPSDEVRALDLFGESLELLDPEGRSLARRWQFTFTTCLQEGDPSADFRWRACLEGTAGANAVLRSSSLLLVPALIRPPTGALADLARHGRPAAVPRSEVLKPSPSSPGERAKGFTPLTLRRSTPSTSVRPIEAPIMMPETSEPAGAHPLIASRWKSPRVVGPAAGLLLLLLLLFAFIWPGWFSKWPIPGPSTLPTPANPPARVVPESDPPATARSEIVPPATKESNSNPSHVDKGPPSETVAPAPTPAALAALERLWHQVPTLLVFREAAGRAEWAVQPGEDLSKMFKIIKEKSHAAVEAGLLVGPLAAILPKPTTNAPFTADLAANSARVQTAEGRVLEFDFGSLLPADSTGPGKLSFNYGMGADASNCLSILFKPAPEGGGGFQPVRLLVVSPGPWSSPLLLDTSLLVANQASLDRSLQEPLLSRKKLVRFAVPGLGFQLLPFIQSRRNHLYDAWPDKRDWPEPGAELNFASVRGRLDQRIRQEEGEIRTKQKRRGELKQSLDQDLVLGGICGANQPTNDVHCFQSFIKHHPAKLAHDAYRSFLWAVLEHLRVGGVPVSREVFEGLQSLDPALQKKAIGRYRNELIQALTQANHPAESERVQNLPEDYFEEKWRELAKKEGDPYPRWKAEHDHLGVEIAGLRERAAGLRHQLQETPRTLAEAASISLYVTRGDVLRGGTPLLEFARFSNGPARPKEGSR